MHWCTTYLGLENRQSCIPDVHDSRRTAALVSMNLRQSIPYTISMRMCCGGGQPTPVDHINHRAKAYTRDGRPSSDIAARSPSMTIRCQGWGANRAWPRRAPAESLDNANRHSDERRGRILVTAQRGVTDQNRL